MEYFPFVVQALSGENHTVYAHFSDGSIRHADISGMITPGTVFEALLDEEFFRDRLTVIGGAVAWDITGDRNAAKCIDLDPVTMYQTARIVKDPLEAN